MTTLRTLQLDNPDISVTPLMLLWALFILILLLPDRRMTPPHFEDDITLARTQSVSTVKVSVIPVDLIPIVQRRARS